MRQLVLILLCGLVGCDTPGVHPKSLDAGLVIELETESLLRLTSDGRSSCAERLFLGHTTSRAGLVITVRGLWSQNAICVFDTLPSGTVELPMFEEVLEVSISHNGATDQYRIRETSEGRQLEAVQTSSTRPGPR